MSLEENNQVQSEEEKSAVENTDGDKAGNAEKTPEESTPEETDPEKASD